ncbi:MAG: Ribosomal RNA small subunit methyltransferase Nep1 [Candidatus Bathyarchaeota archaeon BA1]|nr:MAG: Ribosomal RNA small subunit methyltransferase Nep1 [Candidatus Bathyarchaeota archaeon BA1]
MLILVLAESALEMVPKGLWRHPAVHRHAKRMRKHPRFLLLDRSYHHAAMKALEDGEKRGRPDIVHLALLEALGSPLNKERLLQVYVHTINDHVITVNPEARLPRNYNRFVCLMEQLFELSRAPPIGAALLKLEHKIMSQLLHEVKPDYVMAFSRTGESQTLEEATLRLSGRERPAVLVGGFPHGRFSEETVKLANEVVSIDPDMLETWTVTSRVIYEYERAISLPKKRLKRC